jgi:hypothetical protein
MQIFVMSPVAHPSNEQKGAMRNLLRLTIPLVVATVAGLVAAGEPTTLLGKWMKPNVGAPLAGQDFDTLQKSLQLVADKPPPGEYPKWSSIAKDGADASAKKDLAAVKKTCKTCHDLYKEKYKKELATRPFP